MPRKLQNSFWRSCSPYSYTLNLDMFGNHSSLHLATSRPHDNDGSAHGRRCFKYRAKGYFGSVVASFFFRQVKQATRNGLRLVLMESTKNERGREVLTHVAIQVTSRARIPEAPMQNLLPMANIMRAWWICTSSQIYCLLLSACTAHSKPSHILEELHLYNEAVNSAPHRSNG